MTFATTLTEITAAASSDVVAFNTLSDRNDNTTITWNEGDLAQVGTGTSITTYVYDGPTRKGPFTSDADIALWKEIGGGGGGGGVPTAADSSNRALTTSTKALTLTAGYWKIIWRGGDAFMRIQNGWGNIEGGYMNFPDVSLENSSVYVFNETTGSFDHVSNAGLVSTNVWSSTLQFSGAGNNADSSANAIDLELIVSGSVEIRMVTTRAGTAAATTSGAFIATQIT